MLNTNVDLLMVSSCEENVIRKVSEDLYPTCVGSKFFMVISL
jgi:hypothetical protein